ATPQVVGLAPPRGPRPHVPRSEPAGLHLHPRERDEVGPRDVLDAPRGLHPVVALAGPHQPDGDLHDEPPVGMRDRLHTDVDGIPSTRTGHGGSSATNTGRLTMTGHNHTSSSRRRRTARRPT